MAVTVTGTVLPPSVVLTAPAVRGDSSRSASDPTWKVYHWTGLVMVLSELMGLQSAGALLAGGRASSRTWPWTLHLHQVHAGFREGELHLPVLAGKHLDFAFGVGLDVAPLRLLQSTVSVARGSKAKKWAPRTWRLLRRPVLEHVHGREPELHRGAGVPSPFSLYQSASSSRSVEKPICKGDVSTAVVHGSSSLTHQRELSAKTVEPAVFTTDTALSSARKGKSAMSMVVEPVMFRGGRVAYCWELQATVYDRDLVAVGDGEDSLADVDVGVGAGIDRYRGLSAVNPLVVLSSP